MKYESMIFYRSFYEAIRELPVENQLNVFTAICKYGLEGEETKLNGIEKVVFLLIKPQIDANNSRKENGKKGGRPRGIKKPMVSEGKNQTKTELKPMVFENENQTETEPKPNVNVNANANANANKKTYGFVPPTVDDVKQYCRERKNIVDAEQFVNFYSSKGWMVGKNKMRDWKAAVRTWEKNSGGNKTKQQIQNDFIESNLADDLDEIERLSAERMMRA